MKMFDLNLFKQIARITLVKVKNWNSSFLSTENFKNVKSPIFFTLSLL